MHPRAQIRKVTIVHVASRMKLRLRAVVAVGGPHRTDDGDLVDVAGRVRKPVAHLDAALASVLPGAELLASSALPRWQTAWDRHSLLLLFFVLLAAEWTLRRRNGLL